MYCIEHGKQIPDRSNFYLSHRGMQVVILHKSQIIFDVKGEV